LMAWKESGPMPDATLLAIDLPGLRKLKGGKVREIFDLGDSLLLVATDRISAFDCVMPNGIPRKGEVLTRLTHFWLDRLQDEIPNHRLVRFGESWPTSLKPYQNQLGSRSMLVRKAEPLPIECVVRGYLAGSGWKEYGRTQSVCGVDLPSGLAESDELPEPIFTPATKADSGHDINISFDQAANRVGLETASKVREMSLSLYCQARDYAKDRGILIADTKFEFGWLEGQLILIDEVLTPDSSRFWPRERYRPGTGQPSFDKQFVRDYLLTLDWDRTPPAPSLPDAIVAQTSSKYLEAYALLVGNPLD